MVATLNLANFGRGGKRSLQPFVGEDYASYADERTI
jgi:hypothetical protein